MNPISNHPLEKEAYNLGEEEKDYALAGTAEVPMVGYHSNEILEEKDLPLRSS